MTPTAYYQQALAAGKIQHDYHQLPVIEKLTRIALALESNYSRRWLVFRSKKPVTGLYLWGSVGIGKTFLMDCFYQCLTVPKLRLHFHAFMQRIHQSLNATQGKKNPLAVVAKEIAQETRVICFDEFFVSDIADAMILGELFRHLFQKGVTLIASSNIPPDLLYKDGLQRERFLPAIALLKKYTDTIHLHSTMDYRKQQIRQTGVFYTPLNELATTKMQNAFTHFSQGHPLTTSPITLCDRQVSIVQQAGSVVWVNFEVICGLPRSQMDYLALTQQFHTVMIEDLRTITQHEPDRLLLFVYLIDILYDAHCRLIVSSAVPIRQIYLGEKSQCTFERTLSRLTEMQSEKYVYHDNIGEEFTGL